MPDRFHTTELPLVVLFHNPVVEGTAKKFLYREGVTEIAAMAEMVRTRRKERGWSAAETARKVVGLARLMRQPMKLSQQAVSKFETGKGKSVPNWVRLFEMACELDKLSPEEQIRELNVRANFMAPSLPLSDRMQMVSLMVAFPGEQQLTQMFEMMIQTAPTVEIDNLPRELAKLLPGALEQLRFSIFELTSKPVEGQRS